MTDNKLIIYVNRNTPGWQMWKKEYMKATIDELETNSKIKNIRDWYSGTYDFKKGY